MVFNNCGCTDAVMPRQLNGMGDIILDGSSDGTDSSGYGGVVFGTDPGMSTGADGTPTDGVGSGIGSDVSSILNSVGTLATVYNTQQIMQTNQQRARQGLPPLDQSAYAPQVAVGLSKDTKTLIIAALVGVGLLLVLNKRRG